MNSRCVAFTCYCVCSLGRSFLGSRFPVCSESLNSVDHAASDNPTSSLGSIPKLPLAFEAQQESLDLDMDGDRKSNSQKNAI